jgi:hypothetical protein
MRSNGEFVAGGIGLGRSAPWGGRAGDGQRGTQSRFRGAGCVCSWRGVRAGASAAGRTHMGESYIVGIGSESAADSGSGGKGKGQGRVLKSTNQSTQASLRRASENEKPKKKMPAEIWSGSSGTWPRTRARARVPRGIVTGHGRVEVVRRSTRSCCLGPGYKRRGRHPLPVDPARDSLETWRPIVNPSQAPPVPKGIKGSPNGLFPSPHPLPSTLLHYSTFKEFSTPRLQTPLHSRPTYPQLTLPHPPKHHGRRCSRCRR